MLLEVCDNLWGQGAGFYNRVRPTVLRENVINTDKCCFQLLHGYSKDAHSMS